MTTNKNLNKIIQKKYFRIFESEAPKLESPKYNKLFTLETHKHFGTRMDEQNLKKTFSSNSYFKRKIMSIIY